MTFEWKKCPLFGVQISDTLLFHIFKCHVVAMCGIYLTNAKNMVKYWYPVWLRLLYTCLHIDLLNRIYHIYHCIKCLHIKSCHEFYNSLCQLSLHKSWLQYEPGNWYFQLSLFFHSLFPPLPPPPFLSYCFMLKWFSLPMVSRLKCLACSLHWS